MNLPLLLQLLIHQLSELLAELLVSLRQRPKLPQYGVLTEVALGEALIARGVPRDIVADMFDFRTRTYFRKLEKSREQQLNDPPKTLWSLILEYIHDEGGEVGHDDLLSRFSGRNNPDRIKLVEAVLKELVRCERLYKTGDMPRSRYLLPNAQLEDRLEQHQKEALLHMVWLGIFTDGPLPSEQLKSRFPREPQEYLDAVLEELVSRGNIEQTDSGYQSNHWLLDHGKEAPWAVALLDHFQTVTRCFRQKLSASMAPESKDIAQVSLNNDLIGGSTYSFDLWQGHPLAPEVLGLIEHHRNTLNALWERTEAMSKAAGNTVPDEQRYRVYFYVGQGFGGGPQPLPADRPRPPIEDRSS